MDYTYWADYCLRQNRIRQYQGDRCFFEGHGPLQIGIIIEAAVVNHEKTQAKLAEIFAEFGGFFGQKTAWLFQEKGQIVVSKYINGLDEDAIVLVALGAGAENVIFDEGDLVKIICSVGKLDDVAEILTFEDLIIAEAGRAYFPKDLFAIEGEQSVALITALMDKLIAQEEVTAIAANFLINDKIGEKLGYPV